MRLAMLGTTSAALALSVSSAAVLAQQANPPAPAASVNLCEELVRFVEQRGNAQPASPVTLDQARGFQRANNLVACRDGWVRVQGAGIALPAAVVAVVQQPARAADGTQITVQQPAPAVRVEQAAPQVTVQQPQPQITVRQPNPEILVRQPAPTVTVNIPQPEIIVRMPQPEVNVAQAQPQVQVNQPRPEVQVVQPAQPQVQVTPAQPQVLVQRPLNQEANVQVQQAEGQPQIRYERAEPQVTVNQAQGQPTVRVERIGEAQAGQGMAVAGQGMAAAAGTREIRASELRDMNVVNARGEQIGDVERLVSGQDSRVYAVIGHGGFLGLGEKEIAMPLDQLTLHGGRLMAGNLTDEQIRAMPSLTRNDNRYREVENTFTAPLRVAAIAPTGAGTAAPATRPGAVTDPAERRRAARERIGEDVATTGNVTTGAAARPAQTRTIRAGEFEDLNIYNARGELLGDVERVIVNPADNRQYVVIGHGGFLGLFEDEVALPLDRLFVRGDRIMIRGITDEELDQMPEWRNRYANARELADNTTVTMGVER